MALTTRRMFELERMKRQLQTCRDVETLQEIGTSLLSLYLKQQDVVEELVRANWLPSHTAP